MERMQANRFWQATGGVLGEATRGRMGDGQAANCPMASQRWAAMQSPNSALLVCWNVTFQWVVWKASDSDSARRLVEVVADPKGMQMTKH